MLLIPAIDLKDGQCVRLRQGDMNDSTTFSEDPAAIRAAVRAGIDAEMFATSGATNLLFLFWI